MATAKKLPSGNYRIRVYDKTTKTYKSFTASTKREAERLAGEWLDNPSTDDDNSKTFKKAAEEYIEIKTPVLSPTTIREYKSELRNHFERFADMQLKAITPQLVQDWVNSMAVARSAKTVRNVYGFFTAVMAYHDVDIKLGKIRLPQKTRTFKDLPDAETIIELFRGTDIEIPVLLAVWGGLRMSEIQGIRRKDIVGDILTLSQVRVMVGNKLTVKKQAKTYKSNRQVKLGKQLIDMIDALELSPDDYIVQYNPKRIYDRLVKITRSAGYHITFHDLRHISASVMAKLNIPDIYAMERGGWSNTSTLRSVYQQTFDSDRQRVDKIIDDYFQHIYDTKYDTKTTK